MSATCTCTPMPNGNAICSGGACGYSGDKLLSEELLSQKRIDKRNKHCHAIREALKATPEKMTLVTGAGIGVSAGLPNWYNLISRMLGSALYAGTCASEQKALSSDRLVLYRAMMSGKLSILTRTNVLESAEYITKVLQMDRDIDESRPLETRVLQSLITPILRAGKDAASFLKEHSDKKSNPYELATQTGSSLAAAAYLMWRPDGFRRVMTYNYDTLLQQYLIGVFGLPEAELVTHVEQMTEKPGATREVFHLHGCIPSVEDGDENYQSTYGSLSRELILSEDSYYEVEKQSAYNWFNTIQSYYLNNSSCVFVGFSGEDYNFRRILRQLGHQPRGQHYIVITIDDLYKDIYQSICLFYHDKSGALTKTPAEIAAQAQLLLNDIMETKEFYWSSYGFTPIWVTVEDIPTIMVSMLPS